MQLLAEKVVLPVKNSSLLQDVSKVDVSIQEVGIKSDCLLKVVDGQPDFPLRVENAAQVAPCDSKVRSCFDCF